MEVWKKLLNLQEILIMTDIYRLILPSGEIEYAQKHSIGNGKVSFHLAFDQGGGDKDSIIVDVTKLEADGFSLPNIGDFKIEPVKEADPKVLGLKFD